MAIPPHERHPHLEEIYTAGEWVAAGTYRQIDTNRYILLMEEDFLPASLDGRVACYERLIHAWHQIQQHEQRSRSQDPAPER